MINFYVLDGLKIGGIENQALTLSAEENVDEENYLLNLNKNINNFPKKFFKQKKFRNLRIIEFQRKKGILISLMVFKIFKEYKPNNVIIYFNNINSLWVVLGAKFARINNIAICIQNAVTGKTFKNYISIIMLKIFNKIKVKLVPCSEAIIFSYKAINKNIKFDKVIPNCINKKYFQEEIQIFKMNKKLDDLKTIIMVARLDKIKDQETLIKAFAQIKTKCKLILVGDGEKREKLESIAIDLGLDPKKIFLGIRLDISKLLAKADIFALSTTQDEGFGIVLIEAMAAGLPIIASDVPACREVLDDGNAGILVPAGRVDIWIKEIKGLIKSQNKIKYYENKSYQNIGKYDVKNVKILWEKLFRK